MKTLGLSPSVDGCNVGVVLGFCRFGGVIHMSESGHPRTARHRLRSFLALSAGILIGAALAVAEEMWDLCLLWLEHKQTTFLSRQDWAVAYIEFALAYAVGIALVASLIWWMLGPKLRRHLASALILGFVLTTTVWLASNTTTIEFWDTIRDALYLGAKGAIAGAVVWWLSHPGRKNLLIANG